MSILSNSRFFKINIQNVDFGKSTYKLILICKIVDFIKSNQHESTFSVKVWNVAIMELNKCSALAIYSDRP